MPTATKREESEYKLPEGMYFPAILKSVEEVKIDYTVKKGPDAGKKAFFFKWKWTFEVTSGDFQGTWAYGDTEAELTTREDNKVRQWGETLLGRELELGEEFDTDLIVGVACVISVRHEEPREKRDGSGYFYGCPVDEVLPAASGADDPWSEPPF